MNPTDILAKVPFLAGLGKSELAALAARSTSKRLARDEIVFEQGDPARARRKPAAAAAPQPSLFNE